MKIPNQWFPSDLHEMIKNDLFSKIKFNSLSLFSFMLKKGTFSYSAVDTWNVAAEYFILYILVNSTIPGIETFPLGK